MQVTQPGGQLWNQAMQVTSPDDQINFEPICNKSECTTNTSGTIWRPILQLMQVEPYMYMYIYNWPNLETMQVAFFLAGEITQVKKSIPWQCFLSPPSLNSLQNFWGWGGVSLTGVPTPLRAIDIFNKPCYVLFNILLLASKCVSDW